MSYSFLSILVIVAAVIIFLIGFKIQFKIFKLVATILFLSGVGLIVAFLLSTGKM